MVMGCPTCHLIPVDDIFGDKIINVPRLTPAEQTLVLTDVALTSLKFVELSEKGTRLELEVGAFEVEVEFEGLAVLL